MRVIALKLEDIKFDKRTYDLELQKSIAKRGFAFPIKVKWSEDGYQCVDGHKRLSALADIGSTSYKEKIPVIVTNTDAIRSNDCWRGRNTH